MGYSTQFDNNNGIAYITGGQACWTEMMDVIKSLNTFASEQLTRLEENGIYLEDYFDTENLPSKEAFQALVDEIDTYTEGQILVTSWKWSIEGFEGGDSAGICVDQQGGP